ncbi:MAG: hypothetical protein AAF598_05810 [Bacteroidota bacterium]
MSQPRRTNEMLVGISAMIISLTSLFVFIYQTNLIRKEQYMSVYPHLNLTNAFTGSLNYKYVLQNEGVGPAFITKLHIEHRNGETYPDLLTYLEEVLQPEDSVAFHYSDLYVGQLVQANETINLFGLSGKSYTDAYGLPTNTVASANKLRDALNSDSLTIRLSYKSIYDEEWSITAESYVPQKQ